VAAEGRPRVIAATAMPRFTISTRTRLARLLWTLVFLLAAIATEGQEVSGIVGEYTLTGWTEREGLASPRVLALAQSADGYLWLGTTDGLIRFDGTRFLRWDAFGATALPSGRIQTLCSSQDGSLWIGYSNGMIARIAQGQVTVFDAETTNTGGDVGTILEDRNGTIWAGSRNGLRRFDNGVWTRLGPEHGLPDGPVLSAYQDKSGAFWAASYTAVYRAPAGSSRFEAVASASYFAHRITRDATGTVWITDPRTGFRRITDKPGSWPSTAPEVTQALGVQLLPDRRGNLWVATLGHGLWRTRTGERTPAIEVLGKKEGLLNDLVRSLLEDQQGNVWLGTDYGLYRLSPNKLIPITNLGVARVVEPGADGSVWVGTTTGLVRFKNDTRRVYGHAGELPSPFVTALHRDDSGALWIATDNGIARFDHERFVKVPIEGGMPLNRVYSITTDGNGSLWLCDFSQGLFRLHDGKLWPIDVTADLTHRSILSIHGDGNGRIWAALTGGGLGFFERGEPWPFTRLDDIPDAGAKFNAVFRDPSGSTLLATSAGLWRYEGGRVSSTSDGNGLPRWQTLAMAADADGWWWLATAAGIVRLNPAVVHQPDPGPPLSASYSLWDSYDGAAGLPIWGSSNGARDDAGRLWFVTSNGISIVDPARLRESPPTPPVRIEWMLAGTKRFDASGPITLPPHTSPVQIDYTAVMLSSAHKVRFRYRLDNFDAEWTDAGGRREAMLTNLPPGSYTFRVTAAATDGSIGNSFATLDFTIRPTFFQTRWFYVVLASMLILAVWQAWRLRLHYMQRQFSLVINERIRMSREIHDTLLQSLIGVALQLDVMAAAVDLTEAARANLIRVRRQLEEDIRETRQSLFNLRSPKLEKSDLAATLRDAGRKLTAGTTVQFSLTVTGTPHRCRPEVEQQLLRIGEQAILNSVRHGSAKQVHVMLGFQPHLLRLRVADNGRGFDQARELSDGDSRHYGLAGMKERAKEIGGTLVIDTHSGGGTVVEAAVPL
jgi:signal transduction histidine kinase/ligand-binding sensor domain-containing protein